MDLNYQVDEGSPEIRRGSNLSDNLLAHFDSLSIHCENSFDVKNSTIIPKTGSNICDLSEIQCSPIYSADSYHSTEFLGDNSFSLVNEALENNKNNTCANLLKYSDSSVLLASAAALKAIREESNSDSFSSYRTHPWQERQKNLAHSEGSNTPGEIEKIKKHKGTHHSCVPSAPPYWKRTPVALPPVNRSKTPPFAYHADNSSSTPSRPASWEERSPRLVTPRCDLYRSQPTEMEKLEGPENDWSVKPNNLLTGETVKKKYDRRTLAVQARETREWIEKVVGPNECWK